MIAGLRGDASDAEDAVEYLPIRVFHFRTAMETILDSEGIKKLLRIAIRSCWSIGSLNWRRSSAS